MSIFGKQAWPGARRCSRCSINYPNSSAYVTCELCGEETNVFTHEQPHEDWEERVTAFRNNNLPPMVLEQSKDGIMIQLPVLPVVVHHDGLFIYARQGDAKLVLEDWALIRIGKQVFEVLGRLTLKDVGDVYWIRSFEMTAPETAEGAQHG